MTITVARLTPLALLVGLCTLAPIPSTAADRPCEADVQKFCSGVKMGGGQLRKCLMDHEAELSDPCKARIAHAKAEKEHHKACAADAEKLCKDVKPGGGAIVKCLNAHEADLSPECKAERAAHHHRHGMKPDATPQPTPTK